MRRKVKLFLITGEAGVGKSTYAHRLADDINAEVLEISKPIKDIAYELGWDGLKDECGRSLLQRIGREGRELSYKIWVNSLLKEIFKRMFVKQEQIARKIKTFRFTVPDVRFDDEVLFFKKHFDDVEVHKVVRDNFENGLTEEQKKDITERGVSEQLIDKIVKRENE